MEALQQGQAAGLDAAVCLDVELMVREMLALLAVWLEDVGTRSATASLIDGIVDLRQEMRQSKQWAITDQLRDLLAMQGIQVEDSRSGSSWRWAD
jgi:cysteinyl-tRNA synthetase